MTTTLENPKSDKSNAEKARVLAAIIMEPEEKTSKSGNVYTKLVLATSNGTGSDVIWNATIMDKLRQKLPSDLFKKFAYAKFNGVATHRPYTSKKTGKEEMAHDLFVDSVSLPDGTIVYQNDKREAPAEGADEDVPF